MMMIDVVLLRIFPVFFFFCISKGEDCERNRDADHSEKSKKVHLNVARKKICLINVVVFLNVCFLSATGEAKERSRCSNSPEKSEKAAEIIFLLNSISLTKEKKGENNTFKNFQA